MYMYQGHPGAGSKQTINICIYVCVYVLGDVRSKQTINQSKFTLNLKTATTSVGLQRKTKNPRVCIRIWHIYDPGAGIHMIYLYDIIYVYVCTYT